MKRLYTWVSALLLTLLCVFSMETSAQAAMDFPTLNIEYDENSRSVISACESPAPNLAPGTQQVFSTSS